MAKPFDASKFRKEITKSIDGDEAPAAATPVAKPAAGGQNAQDILAMIRARQNKS